MGEVEGRMEEGKEGKGGEMEGGREGGKMEGRREKRRALLLTWTLSTTPSAASHVPSSSSPVSELMRAGMIL